MTRALTTGVPSNARLANQAQIDNTRPVFSIGSTPGATAVGRRTLNLDAAPPIPPNVGESFLDGFFFADGFGFTD